jgi:calcineurin-like phosphoesterase family protein
MIWFTADTHFGHANIIRYSNRPFEFVEEMDDVLIENINKVVGSDDILYHLGDWSYGSGTDKVRDYRIRIRCQHIILILGNHDKEIEKHLGFYRTLFKEIHPMGLEIQAGAQPMTLCHYAMRVWNQSHRGSWHLYGHSHGSLPEDPTSLSFDVGVDCCNYRPLSLDEVAEKMRAKKFVPIDHHKTGSLTNG